MTEREEIEALIWRILRRSYLELLGAPRDTTEGAENELLSPWFLHMESTLRQIMVAVERAEQASAEGVLERVHAREVKAPAESHELLDQALEASGPGEPGSIMTLPEQALPGGEGER
jgi:hypothetical protein